MQTPFTVLLYLHIGSGSVALLAGAIALVAPKWSSTHRMAGRTFYYSTLIVALSAITMAFLKGKTFLLHIGIFTFYQNHAGFRSVLHKKLQASPLDKAVLFINLLNSSVMLLQGSVVLLVFGIIGLALGLQDLNIYYRLYKQLHIDRFVWMRRHLGMFIGSYIAIFTAVLVVNSNGQLWIWLGPTLAFSPLLVYWNLRISRNKPPHPSRKPAVALLIPALLLLSKLSEAQPYVEGGNTRHRFAQLNLGVNSRFSPVGPTALYQLDASGALVSQEVGWHTANRLVIGGTHFWGHADFLVAFPILQSRQSGYQERIESSFRFFPWRIESHKARPYIGFSHMASQYSSPEGGKMFRHRMPVSAGVYYLHNRLLFEMGVSYVANNHFDYHYTRLERRRATTYPLGIQIGIKRMLETTASAETNWKNGKTAYYTDTLAKLGRLDGFTLGFGPSASFFTAKSPGLANTAAWLYQHKSAMMAEIMAGYYWHKSDLQLSMVYRQLGAELEA